MINLIDMKNQFYAYAFTAFEKAQVRFDETIERFLEKNYPGALISCFAPHVIFSLHVKYGSGIIVDDFDRHPLRLKRLPSYKNHRYEILEGKFGALQYPAFLKYLNCDEESLERRMEQLQIEDRKYALALALCSNRMMLKDFLKNFEYYYIAEYEADDVIAHLARFFASMNITVNIVSTDKDFQQLWDYPRYQEFVLINGERYLARSFPPFGFLKSKALLGDPSDNIPKALKRGYGKSFLRRCKTFPKEFVDQAVYETNLSVIKFDDEYLGKRDLSFVEHVMNIDITWRFYDGYIVDQLHWIFMQNKRRVLSEKETE